MHNSQFKSTLDKKRSIERPQPVPAPYSRVLRDNKSAPTPSRGAPRGYNNVSVDSLLMNQRRSQAGAKAGKTCFKIGWPVTNFIQEGQIF